MNIIIAKISFDHIHKEAGFIGFGVTIYIGAVLINHISFIGSLCISRATRYSTAVNTLKISFLLDVVTRDQGLNFSEPLLFAFPRLENQA